MNSLQHFPLGTPFPSSPHAVASSLPTMADVRAYEEKDARVVEAMASGYPRFVVHVYVRDLIAYYIEREGLAGRGGVLVPSRRAAQELVDYTGGKVLSLEVEDGLYFVYYNREAVELSEMVRKYVQHVGCGISSRQAEDLLLSCGKLKQVHAESSFTGNAPAEVERQFAELCGCRSADVLVCASGMNAFYAGFRAVQEFQRSRGRKRWLQLGWLYLDSGCILKEFLGDDESLEYCYDVNDLAALLDAIAAAGESLAGVVVECPTNPLVQLCDLKRVSEMVRAAGGVLIVDPTIASVYNMYVLRYADLLVSSLTKYACYVGDVMIGALALNPDSPFYGDLVLRTSAFHLPPYRRDLARLADEMQTAPEIVAQLNANAARLAEYLNRHPAVKRVHWAAGSPHFTDLAKTPSSCGAMVSIELNGAIEPFYDSIRAMKGPSFGTQFTLLSPFMYLAHYDLVTSDSGRTFLREVGIAPELIRISVGLEPYAEIEAAFDEALSTVLVDEV